MKHWISSPISVLILGLFIQHSLSAQIVLFEDNFEAYAIGTDLASKGYGYWGNTFKVFGQEDNKYAQSQSATTNSAFNRTFTLEAGKTYSWTVSTRRTVETGSNYFLSVKSGNHKYDEVQLNNGITWETNTIEFTVERGLESVTLQVYHWPSSIYCIDNFKLIDTEKTSSIKTRLSGIFSDNMVLQRNSNVKFWGKDDPGKEITIEPGWDTTTYGATTGETGKWSISIPTPEAGGPYTVSIRGTDEIDLKNILLGDVWLCSGQSNMQWMMQSGVDGGTAAIASSADSQLRQIQISRSASLEPQEFASGSWLEASPESTGEFSAVAYFFGKMLRDSLNIPIGLINASYGGSLIEAWMDRETLDTIPFVTVPETLESKVNTTPTAFYNTMIHPIEGYSIRGTIWYQGEGNRGKPEEYRILLPTLINSWRAKWQSGTFPFYFVQIAPFGTSNQLPFWQMLTDVHHSTDSTGMVITLDVGNCSNVHPTNKRPVGERLALWSLANEYGHEGFEYSGPIAETADYSGNKLTVHFAHANSGLSANEEPISGFEVAGDNQTYYAAEAEINGSSIILSSPMVPNPRYARYGNGACSEIKAVLFNSEGLPASAFVLGSEGPTSTQDRADEPELHPYPNPTNSKLYLNGMKRGDLLEVYDLTGNLVRKEYYIGSIDISGLLPGVYILRSKDLHSKFVKNRSI